jgi:hypothetical protein
MRSGGVVCGRAVTVMSIAVFFVAGALATDTPPRCEALMQQVAALFFTESSSGGVARTAPAQVSSATLLLNELKTRAPEIDPVTLAPFTTLLAADRSDGPSRHAALSDPLRAGRARRARRLALTGVRQHARRRLRRGLDGIARRVPVAGAARGCGGGRRLAHRRLSARSRMGRLRLRIARGDGRSAGKDGLHRPR